MVLLVSTDKPSKTFKSVLGRRAGGSGARAKQWPALPGYDSDVTTLFKGKKPWFTQGEAGNMSCILFNGKMIAFNHKATGSFALPEKPL
jgi:hypothetical protein